MYKKRRLNLKIIQFIALALIVLYMYRLNLPLPGLQDTTEVVIHITQRTEGDMN